MGMILESSMIKHMELVAPITATAKETNSYKMTFKEVAISFIGEDKYYRLKADTRKAIDYILMLCTKKGFAYPSIKHIVNKYSISEATLKRATKLLRDVGMLAVAYRRLRGFNAQGGAVYFLTNHPYYVQWKEMLSLEVEPVDNSVDMSEIKPPFIVDELPEVTPDELPEKAVTPSESKADEVKKSSNLLDLISTKLRDLINIAPKYVKIERLKEQQNVDVLSADQLAGMDKILKGDKLLPYWRDNAFNCARNLPKKMDAVAEKALELVISDVMGSYQPMYDAERYFVSCFHNELERANNINRINGKPYVDLTPETPNKIVFYNWLDERE